VDGQDPEGLPVGPHEKAKQPKELHVVDGATHIDMYDRRQFVKPGVEKLTPFFGRHLAEGVSS